MSVPQAFSDPSLSIASWAVLDSGILSDWETWFDAHVDSSVRNHPDAVENLELKREHTHLVCREIGDVGKSLGLSRMQLNLAEALALFHDVGRFRQYAQYGTFADSRSEDHAALGVRVIREAGLLNQCDTEAGELIRFAVGQHNQAYLPDDTDATHLFFTRLLRDADKLDIWRVVTTHYRRSRDKQNNGVTLDMPDTSDISETICDDLLTGRIARMTDIRTVHDFKLLQLGWVFDLNFTRSFQLLHERSYLEQIRAVLPDDPRVDAIYDAVTAHIQSHLLTASPREISPEPLTK